MMQTITFVANTAGENTGLFASLGIDWMMLLYQVIAFLILLFLLQKFVFPTVIKSIDDREKKIADGQRAAEEALERADTAQGEIAAIMKQARVEAAEIVNDAKDQAMEIVTKSEQQAKEKAESIVEAAQEEIRKETNRAKKELYNETIDLVARVAENVVTHKVTSEIDEASIKASLKEVSK